MTPAPSGFAPARAARLMGGLLVVLACHGCASSGYRDPRDPIESFNRGVYAFNEGVDEAVFRPAAIAYRDFVPPLVRTGVHNILGNFDDAWSFVNNTLQLKGRRAMDSFFRFGVNTVIGLFGVFDVASEMNIERHAEDFGQTLGHWGFGSGPYLVLPLFGPSTFRDAVGLRVDFIGDITGQVDPTSARNSLRVLNVLDTRTGLLSVSSTLDEVALDKYSFTRDAYLQRRRNAIYDGNPPQEDFVTEPDTR